MDLALIFTIAAVIFIFIGGFIILVEAFRESVLWGVACLLLPIVSLFFLIVHWNAAKRGFVIQLFGLALLATALLVRGIKI